MRENKFNVNVAMVARESKNRSMVGNQAFGTVANRKPSAFHCQPGVLGPERAFRAYGVVESNGTTCWHVSPLGHGAAFTAGCERAIIAAIKAKLKYTTPSGKAQMWC